jgi:hypothetical protein
MGEFNKIYLVWRKGAGQGREIVGTLEKKADGRGVFSYAPEVEQLTKKGFTPYVEFKDLHKAYNGNVIEIFGQRLTKGDRPDISRFYDFWEVDAAQKDDQFYLLGKTQGLVPTDNFEFLAEYHMQPGVHFLTEIAGLSVTKIAKGAVQNGDILRFELDPSNSSDPFAVKVFKGNLHVGFIKKVHSRIFHENGGEALKLAVKALEQNGFIKRIFVKVSV